MQTKINHTSPQAETMLIRHIIFIEMYHIIRRNKFLLVIVRQSYTSMVPVKVARQKIAKLSLPDFLLLPKHSNVGAYHHLYLSRLAKFLFKSDLGFELRKSNTALPFFQSRFKHIVFFSEAGT